MKFVIFDLDGTIVDTIKDIHFALTHTLDYFKFKTFGIDVTTSYVGDGIKTLIKRAIGETAYTPEIEVFFRKTYANHIVDHSEFFDGVKSVLEYIESSIDKSFILSNKSFDLTDQIVQHFRLNTVFDSWHGGDSFIEKKPSAYPIQQILMQYQINSDDVVMIGDSHTDIESGYNAGIKTCYCNYGYGSLSSVQPDYIVNSPKELIQILEK